MFVQQRPVIARAFAVTEKHVYRRLALANLPAPIIDALAAGKINLSMAACFTICDDEKHSVEVLERVRGDHWSDYQLKNMLKPDSVKGSDRRAIFVGVEAYKKAGGRVGGDLFADETLFDDPAILGDVFTAKLTETVKAFATDHGWKWAEAWDGSYFYNDGYNKENFGRVYPVEGDLSEEQAERYDELAELANSDVLDEAGQAELDALQEIVDGDYTDEQKAHAGAVVYVNNEGEVSCMAGLVRVADKAAAEAAGVLEKSRHASASAAPNSPISDKLRGDLGCIETGARQNALLDDPKLALHLFAFQLSDQMGYGTAFGIRKDCVPNVPETDTGYVLDKRLTTPVGGGDSDDRAKAFGAFRKRGDKRIMEILNRYLVSQLSIGDRDLGAMIDSLTKKNTRETLTPTAENFFKRVGGPYLVELWRDLLDLKPDHPTATTFAKLKKGEKADKLEKLFSDPTMRSALGVTEKQATRIDAWLPEGME